VYISRTECWNKPQYDMGRNERLIKFDWNNMTLEKTLSGGLFRQSNLMTMEANPVLSIHKDEGLILSQES